MTIAGEAFIGFPRQSFIILGPAVSPGVCRIRGANSPRSWDVRQGWGFSGATVVYHGTGLSKFDCDIFLWKPEHFIAWDLFAPVLAKPKPGPVGSALGIRHPVVNGPPLNITNVVVEDVTGFEQNDTGLWMCTIKFLEFRAPLPVVARPIAAIPAAGPVPQAPPDPQEKIIEHLMLEQAAKGGSL